MKRAFLLLFVFTLSLYSQAQLEVNSNGRVGIGTSGNTYNPLSVKGDGTGNALTLSKSQYPLYIFNTSQSNITTRYGIYLINRIDTINTYGIHLSNIGTGSATLSYGIRSVGGKSTTLSCGVMGGLSGSGITCGAGIIGSSSTAVSITDQQYSGKYAGFFQGDVRVTGTLYANVLTPTASSGAMNNSDEISVQVVSSSTDMIDESVSNKLSQVPLLRINNATDNRLSVSNETELTESPLLQSLLDKMDNGEELTDEEMIQFNNELNVKEAREAEMEAPQTRMASTRYGLDADQLRRVYPELVYEDQNGNVSINYIEMVPLLVQSINELQERIDNLEQDNANLRSELSGDEISVKSRDGANDIENTETDILSLSQNDPNPFSERTTISLNIPESVTTAAVFFYDMSGKQIAKRVITERGQSQLSVTSSDFSEGMYLYSLIADGKVIATRKMILTK